MSSHQQTEPNRSNQPVPAVLCAHCGGATHHEPWCITCNSVVSYAYEIVVNGRHLTLGDEIILHALGVEWSPYGKKTR